MQNFVATARQVLWTFVELAFLLLLSLILISLLLGEAAGPYITSVTDNVSKFAASTSSGMIGIVIVLALIYLAAKQQGLLRGEFPQKRRPRATRSEAKAGN